MSAIADDHRGGHARRAHGRQHAPVHVAGAARPAGMGVHVDDHGVFLPPGHAANDVGLARREPVAHLAALAIQEKATRVMDGAGHQRGITIHRPEDFAPMRAAGQLAAACLDSNDCAPSPLPRMEWNRGAGFSAIFSCSAKWAAVVWASFMRPCRSHSSGAWH